MNPTQIRLLVYPIATAVIGALGWAAFGYRAEADFMTLVSSASIHAELAASIPADTPKPEGRALREKLIRDAYQWIARADAVAADTSAVRQVRAFLAMTEGRPNDAAQLYRECRSLADCLPEQHGPLAIQESKALSNAGDLVGALRVLDEFQSQVAAEDRLQRDALRARLLWRSGQEQRAVGVAEAIVAGGATGSEACRIGADLLESMGALAAAEAGWRKGEGTDELLRYQVARLKLRAGEVDQALEILGQAAGSGNPEVLRRMTSDESLWVAAIGDERFAALTGPATIAPAAAGR